MIAAAFENVHEMCIAHGKRHHSPNIKGIPEFELNTEIKITSRTQIPSIKL